MQADPTCAEVRYRLALGVKPGAALERHLQSCRDCAAEADWIEELAVQLARGATLEPQATLDSSMRALLRGGAEPRAPFHRSAMAAAFAAVGFLALVLGLAGVLAQGGAAEHGLSLALILASAYLALCAGALTPLLLSVRLGEPVFSRRSRR